MNIEQEILVNKYGQGIVSLEQLIPLYQTLSNDEKRLWLNDLLEFILQSKPQDGDIKSTILSSKLKPTCTPCVLLEKGVESFKLQKIILLPNNELEKVFILFMNLFKIAYNRRFEQEKNNPNKWWYWDLSDNKKVSAIISKYGG